VPELRKEAAGERGVVQLVLLGFEVAPMLMDAETRAVYRAEEQVRGESWRTPDPDERAECDVTECIVCGKELEGTIVWHAAAKKFVQRKPTTGQRVCTPCNIQGWRPKPCVVCGGPTRTWNWSSKERANTNRGKCPKCRAEWHAAREIA
jgi:hypothetical protein